MYRSDINLHIDSALKFAYALHYGHTTKMSDCVVMRDVICGYAVSQHISLLRPAYCRNVTACRATVSISNNRRDIVLMHV